jgi:hypothetical protein
MKRGQIRIGKRISRLELCDSAQFLPVRHRLIGRNPDFRQLFLSNEVRFRPLGLKLWTEQKRVATLIFSVSGFLRRATTRNQGRSSRLATAQLLQ